MYLLRNSCVKYFLAASMFAKSKTCSKETAYHFAIEELCIILIQNVQQILILYYARGKRFVRETSTHLQFSQCRRLG